jgi:DNA-binding LacI/PurR family transcriptional regulator
MKIPEKSKNLEEIIKRNILGGVYAQGEKLPSEREMEKIFGISRSTIRIVVSEMIQAGIIYRSPRSGTFVSEKAIKIIESLASPFQKRAALFMPTSQIYNPFYRTLVTHLEQYLVSEIKFEVCFQSYLNRISLDPAIYDIELIYGCYPESQIMDFIEESPCPILVNRPVPGCNYATTDHFAGGRLICNHILNKNHKHIACLHYGDKCSSYDFSQRYQGIIHEMKENKRELDFSLNIGEGIVPDNNYSQIVDIVLSRTPSITAIICLTDMMSMGVYDALKMKKVKIPKEISVIGFDDQIFSSFSSPPLTSARTPVEAIAYNLSKALNEYLSGKKIRIKDKLASVLVERKSVKELKS